MYMELLENTIQPAFVEILENNNKYLINRLVFLQDVAPSHYATMVRKYFDQPFRREELLNGLPLPRT